MKEKTERKLLYICIINKYMNRYKGIMDYIKLLLANNGEFIVKNKSQSEVL